MVLSHEYKIFILGKKSDHFLTIILVLVFVLEQTVIFEQLLQVQLYQYTVTFWGFLFTLYIWQANYYPSRS